MKIKSISRMLLLIAAALLISSIFIPIWSIELEAPQYPEGLVLLIYANKLGGNVEIINGLNHYIGMATLHSENFIEFTILPFIISSFALFAILVALLSNKKLLYVLFGSFVLFGIISMIDFYRWNYNYGHNLDPNAAIIVPGMAYQPPLIGYKQLLNFGAFSSPDIGGWFFISAGILFLISTIIELRKVSINKTNTFISLILITLLTSCSNGEPKQPKLNKTNCDFCKMTIANDKFISQCITQKNRVYYFDDIACMIKHKSENTNSENPVYYIADYANPQKYINTTNAILIKNDNIKSPMGGNIAAFSNVKDANEFQQKEVSVKVLWLDLVK